MATVRLIQPTNMAALPTLPGQPFVTDYSVSSSTSTAYIACLVDSVLTSIVGYIAAADVTYVEIDTVDLDLVGNFHVSNITLGSSAAVVAALNAGNGFMLMQALLAGKDAIIGSPGDDVLLGFGGNDAIKGGAGADDLRGDAGNDTLTGGLALSESGVTAATRDEIFGFTKGGGAGTDRVDLSPIDADPSAAGNQAFKLVNSFTAAHGEVRFLQAGGNTIIQVDGDNDAAIDMTIFVYGVVGMHGFDLIL